MYSWEHKSDHPHKRNCQLQTVYTSYFVSTKGVSIQVNINQRTLVPTYQLQVTKAVLVSGAVGSIDLEWCEWGHGGGYGSYSILIQVPSSNPVVGVHTYRLQDAEVGSSLGQMPLPETTSSSGSGLSRGTKGWISAVVIVGFFILVCGVCLIHKKMSV